MSSGRRFGWSARIFSEVMPAPSLRRISSTGIRVPQITGFPPMIFGLISIRSWAIGVGPPLEVYHNAKAADPREQPRPRTAGSLKPAFVRIGLAHRGIEGEGV